MNADGRALVEELLAACDRLAGGGTLSFAEAENMARVCRMLDPHIATIDTVENLVLQRLVRTTEEYLLTTVLRACDLEGALPDSLLGDAAADRAEFDQALREAATIRGNGV
jgi:hypothetical protein